MDGQKLEASVGALDLRSTYRAGRVMNTGTSWNDVETIIDEALPEIGRALFSALINDAELLDTNGGAYIRAAAAKVASLCGATE